MEHAFTDNGLGAHPKKRGGGSMAVGPQTPKTEIKKKIYFVDTMASKV
jgi:hypothetical protein